MTQTHAQAEEIVKSVKVVDVDSHVTEPPDLWTSRVSVQKYGDQVLHVKPQPNGRLGWYIGDQRIASAPAGAWAAWEDGALFPPASPGNYDVINASAYDVQARLAWMDEHGVYAQVIYPNVGGFGAKSFLTIKDAQLRIESVRAYNDFLAEWCGQSDGRLIPVASLPLWDVPAAVAEMERAAKLGHRGFLVSNEPQTLGFPLLADPHWDPIWATAEAMGLPLNFHIGGGEFDPEKMPFHPRNGRAMNFARNAMLFFMDNAKAVTETIAAGICHRYPNLKMVSVESGLGWVPFILEAFDWQWLNNGVHEEHPEYTLLPSEYFRQNWYVSFWFEKIAPVRVADFVGIDNIMFETDFPHQTSLTPGPKSASDSPRKHIQDVFSQLPEEWTRKILYENAAKIYGLPL